MRQVIALFDEYQSRENAKHVLRAMKDNARQGFYNGSRVPLGYRAEESEKRGVRVKKKLVIDPAEAETIRLIFRLYRHEDGQSGPLGVMDTLDNLVVDNLSTQLFTTERLSAILSAAFARRAEKAIEVDRRVAALRREMTDAANKLKRLYRMVGDGVTELDDILRDPPTEISSETSETIERLGQVMRKNIANGEVPFRKAYCAPSSTGSRSTITSSASSETPQHSNRWLPEKAFPCSVFAVLYVNGAP